MIISVDADSEKMEPRCQQLEGTTPALIGRPLQLVPRGQYRSCELAFVATTGRSIFLEKKKERQSPRRRQTCSPTSDVKNSTRLRASLMVSPGQK